MSCRILCISVTNSLTMLTSFALSEFSGCTASTNQGKYSCNKAYDGITYVKDNGWGVHSGNSAVWAIFELAEEASMNNIVLVSGQRRPDSRLLSFKVTIKANNQWLIPLGLSIREDANALIGSDGTITLAHGIHVLHLDFNLIANAQSIRLDITKTDSKNNKLVFNEIIPNLFKSK